MKNVIPLHVHPFYVKPQDKPFDLFKEIDRQTAAYKADLNGRMVALLAINKEAMLLVGKGPVIQAFCDAMAQADREGAKW